MISIGIDKTFDSNFLTFVLVNSTAFKTIKYYVKRGLDWYYWLLIWTKIMIQLINGQSIKLICIHNTIDSNL